MTEKTLQGLVIRTARILGWLVYHTYDSRRSEPGFPDLVLVHPVHGIIFAELKTARGELTADQRAWFAAIVPHEGVQAHIWRPKDWESREIIQRLQGERSDP